MEADHAYLSLLTSLSETIDNQESNALCLGELCLKTAHETVCQDHLDAIDVFTAEIHRDFDRLVDAEASTAYASNKARLSVGAAGFGIGLLASAITGRQKPFEIGLTASREILNNKTPVGNVMVSVGGNPVQVKAVSISEQARDLNTNEAEVIKRFRKKGYLLLDFKGFTRTIQEIKTEVAEGRIEPPFHIENQIAALVPGFNDKPLKVKTIFRQNLSTSYVKTD